MLPASNESLQFRVARNEEENAVGRRLAYFHQRLTDLLVISTARSFELTLKMLQRLCGHAVDAGMRPFGGVLRRERICRRGIGIFLFEIVEQRSLRPFLRRSATRRASSSESSSAPERKSTTATIATVRRVSASAPSSDEGAVTTVEDQTVRPDADGSGEKLLSRIDEHVHALKDSKRGSRLRLRRESDSTTVTVATLTVLALSNESSIERVAQLGEEGVHGM